MFRHTFERKYVRGTSPPHSPATVISLWSNAQLHRAFLQAALTGQHGSPCVKAFSQHISPESSDWTAHLTIFLGGSNIPPIAGVAQLVEHLLPKQGVTGSSPVTRSRSACGFHRLFCTCSLLTSYGSTIRMHSRSGGFPGPFVITWTTSTGISPLRAFKE